MNLNLRRKIILAATVVLLITLGANTAIVTLVFGREYREALQDKILVIADGLKLQLSKLLAFGIPLDQLVGFEDECENVVSKYGEVSAALVVDAEGTIRFHSDSAEMGKSITDPAIIGFVNGEEGRIYFHRSEENASRQKNHYDAISPLADADGKSRGAAIVQFPEEVVSKKTAMLFAYSLIISAASFVVAVALILMFITTWLTKPMSKLLTVIEQVREGDLTKTAPATSKDEFGQLAGAFNEMTAKLGESYRGLEEKVQARTGELEEAKEKVEEVNQELNRKVEELERMNKLMVGRELRMAEMKKEMEALRKKLGNG